MVLPAHKIISDIADEQGPLRVVSCFIQDGGGVYVFHGFSAQASFETYRLLLESPMNGFQRLRDTAKLNVLPDRISIQTNKQPAKLQDVLTKFGAKPDDLEKLSLMNGMMLTDRVESGTLI